MVAVGALWEGHELLREERGMVRHFLARPLGGIARPLGGVARPLGGVARPLGGQRELVWLHLREGARIEPGSFAGELERLRRVSDEVPEIVPVLYGGVSGSVAWAASPVLSGATPLLEATRGHELGPAVLKVLIDVGRCLVRAHERALIHGAISPDRVFVAGDGRYAITHFGLVCLFQLGAEEARRDPYGYAPPELLSEGRLGRRTDVYGFGTILYELLCKRPLSTWTWPPSFPEGIPLMLQMMIKGALQENPRLRQPNIERMLAALAPYARAWEELGAPPELPFADLFAEPSGSRRKLDERAPSPVEDEAQPLASGEQVGRAVEPPTPRPSEAPDGVKPRRGHVIDAPPVASPRPSEAPDTLKSAAPPRGARDNAIDAPPVAPPWPAAPDLPDLDPVLLDPIPPVPPPAPSTPPRSPTPPVAPAPLTAPRAPISPAPRESSSPPRSSGIVRRRSLARRLGAAMALAFLLGGSGALLLRWEPSPRRAALPLARVVLGAALRATISPPPPPSDAPQSPPPVAPRSVTNRKAAAARQARKTPSKDGDVCYGFVVCGLPKY